MKKTFLQYLFLSCSVMVLFSACRKDPYKGKETLQSGKTYVWITEAQQNNQFFLPFTNTIPVTMFSVRRDAASKADLQKAVTVTLTAIDITTTAFKAKFGTYSAIPSSLATQASDNSITTSATGVTMNFAAGVFAKNYVLNVNGANFDPSQKYAVAYAITNHGGFSGKHLDDGTSADTIVAVLGVKNIYDGDYSATGSISFPNPASNRSWAARDKPLTTINATTSETEAADLGGNGYYMYLTVNADNTVTVTPAPTSPNQTIQNNGDCTYNPATKTFNLNYKYIGGTGNRVIADVIVHN
ncbi:BT_3044 domain-containing protein [Mucilaginibacter sp.]|uniref:BT_3044 domain-containing protein n=1 Tax=Mucilaginibacter sp. TaxID=1882438 RepID=UPI003D0C1813